MFRCYYLRKYYRVQQGDNSSYNDPNLGSQIIIFDFEIINNLNSYRYTDDLGFLFIFMKDKDNIFNFIAETYNYQGNSPNTGKEFFEQMKGQIDINKFL